MLICILIFLSKTKGPSFTEVVQIYLSCQKHGHQETEFQYVYMEIFKRSSKKLLPDLKIIGHQRSLGAPPPKLDSFYIRRKMAES